MGNRNDAPTMMLPKEAALPAHRASAYVEDLPGHRGRGRCSPSAAPSAGARSASQRLIEQSTRDSFRSTEYVFENLQSARYDRLKRMNALVAEDPVFKAVILETDEATQKDDLPQQARSCSAPTWSSPPTPRARSLGAHRRHRAPR